MLVLDQGFLIYKESVIGKSVHPSQAHSQDHSINPEERYKEHEHHHDHEEKNLEAHVHEKKSHHHHDVEENANFTKLIR